MEWRNLHPAKEWRGSGVRVAIYGRRGVQEGKNLVENEPGFGRGTEDNLRRKFVKNRENSLVHLNLYSFSQ